MKIILLDTETTGFKENRLVQLAYKVQGNQVIYNKYYNPEEEIEVGAMATHHITKEMVENEKQFMKSDGYNGIKAMLEGKGSVIVAHNAKYDIEVLKNEGINIKNYICTQRLAMHLLDSESYSMQYLRYLLKLKISDKVVAHDAKGDVIVLESLFNFLQEQIKEKDVIKEMIAMTQTPVLLKRVMFGKYKDKTWDEVRHFDSGYIVWLHGSEIKKEDKEQNKDLIYTLQYQIDLINKGK